MLRLIRGDSHPEWWESFPKKDIYLERISRCHSTWLVVVRSKDGGYVTANCNKCGKQDTVRREDFDNIRYKCPCPVCQVPMKPTMLEMNYCYKCDLCDLFVWLADLVPDYQQFETDLKKRKGTG